jgi:hypothetical protein
MLQSHFGGPREKNVISWNRRIFVFRLISTDILHNIIESVTAGLVYEFNSIFEVNMPRKRKNTRSTPHESALVRRGPMITPDNSYDFLRNVSLVYIKPCHPPPGSAESGGARYISRRAPGRFRTS